MTNQASEDELREKLHQISNKFVLDVYENNRNGRNSIRAGVKMNKALEELIRTEKLKLLAEAKVFIKAGGYEASYEISMIEKLERI